MSALVRTELLKLRTTRATWGLLAVALALTLARLWLVMASVGTVEAPGRDTADMASAVLGAAGVGSLVVILLGVLAVTGEFRHQTITVTLLRTPDRRRVLAAKAIACALAGMAVGVGLPTASMVVGLAAGIIDLAALGGVLARFAAGFLLGSALYGLLGVGVGALVGNQTVAVVVPLVWFLVIELLIPAYGLRWLVPLTPRGAGDALGGAGFPGALPMWAAGLLLAGYGLALASLGTARIARRDIT